MHTTQIDLSTSGRGFYEISSQVNAFVSSSKVDEGICHVFLRHTSASLLITENADPDVRRDLEYFFSRLIPDGDPAYIHSMEGPDDMPAHIRSVLTSSEITLPVRSNRLLLGTWQGIYLWEHRTQPHKRSLDLTIIPSR